MSEKTIGELRVRTNFNPSKDDLIDKIKQKSAELINLCEEIRISPKLSNSNEFHTNDKESQRLLSLAQTKYEEAAMYAVKAATA